MKTINDLVYVIRSNGERLNYPVGRITSFQDMASSIWIVVPEPELTIAVNYSNYDAKNYILSHFARPTQYRGKDIIETNNELYPLVADWFVYKLEVRDTAVSMIHNSRAGRVGIGFTFRKRTPTQNGVRYLGEFGKKPLPETAQLIGDYYVCDLYNYANYTKGDIAYWDGEKFVKDINYVVKATVGTTDIPVDPTIYAFEPEEIDDDIVGQLWGSINELDQEIESIKTHGTSIDNVFDNRITYIEKNFKKISDNEYDIIVKWKKETISILGDITPSNNRITSDFIELGKNSQVVSTDFNILFYIHYYDSQFNYISNSGEWLKNYFAPDKKYVRLVARYNDNADITNLENVYNNILFKKNEFINLNNNNFLINNLLIGGINTDGTDNNGINIRARSNYIKLDNGISILSNNQNIDFIVHVYDANKNWIKQYDVNWSNRYDAECLYINGYIRLLVRYKDNRVITNIQELCNGLLISNNMLKLKQKYEDTGLIPIAKINGTLGQSIVWVGDELWGFLGNSSDDETTFANAYRYKLNRDTNTLTTVGSFEQNWGHCNTVDYKQETDTIILGSGTGVLATSGRGDYTPRGIFIFENASSFKSLTNVPIQDYGIIINMEAENLGRQFNVVWGEDNNGRNDICYLLSNDGDTVSDYSKVYSTYYIRRIQLGKGANNLGKGTIISGKTENQFNGTYKILNEYSSLLTDATYECIQDGVFYNGKIYTGLGHDGIWFAEITLKEDGTFEAVKKRIKNWYKNDGTNTRLITQALTIKNGELYIRVYNDATETAGLEIYDIYGINVNNYAKKKQEEWITPTLTNGFTGAIKYRKNEFGVVEIKGYITGGAQETTAFVLPTGYRPTETLYFQVFSNSNENVIGYITTSGAVILNSSLPSGYNLYFNSITVYTN